MVQDVLTDDDRARTDRGGGTAPGRTPSCRLPSRAMGCTMGSVTFQVVDIQSVEADPGDHPAGSPYDKRVSDGLRTTAFAVYQVDLPPGAETVPHDHVVDRVEDVYAVLAGDGWVVVDGETVPVRPGHYVSVTLESSRLLRAGEDGLT